MEVIDLNAKKVVRLDSKKEEGGSDSDSLDAVQKKNAANKKRLEEERRQYNENVKRSYRLSKKK